MVTISSMDRIWHTEFIDTCVNRNESNLTIVFKQVWDEVLPFQNTSFPEVVLQRLSKFQNQATLLMVEW